MKKIFSKEEYFKVLVGIFDYFDKTCRKNNIKYSLIAGSLIGAIRHKGIIPWDDDIDVVLTKDNYYKLKKILEKETGRYQLLKYEQGGKQFSFMKLIDTYTYLEEPSAAEKMPDYGVFIDIFCYYPVSNDEKERKKQYKNVELLTSIIARRKLDFKHTPLKKNIARMGKNIVSKALGYKRIHKMYEKVMNRYDNTDYVMTSWPVYGYEKEIMPTKYLNDYIDVEFEGIKAMAFKNYDQILRQVYGDYMKLPPEDERKPRHTLNMWWRKEEYAKKRT